MADIWFDLEIMQLDFIDVVPLRYMCCKTMSVNQCWLMPLCIAVAYHLFIKYHLYFQISTSWSHNYDDCKNRSLDIAKWQSVYQPVVHRYSRRLLCSIVLSDYIPINYAYLFCGYQTPLWDVNNNVISITWACMIVRVWLYENFDLIRIKNSYSIWTWKPIESQSGHVLDREGWHCIAIKEVNVILVSWVRTQCFPYAAMLSIFANRCTSSNGMSDKSVSSQWFIQYPNFCWSYCLETLNSLLDKISIY